MFRMMKMKYNDTYKKYEIGNKMTKYLTSDNVKIMGYIFILSRLYKIYHGVYYDNKVLR